MSRAGQYLESVAFEYRPYFSDGYGNEAAGTWTSAFTVPARIQPLRGGESVQAARLAGKQPVKITVLVSTNTRMITTDWRARDIRSGAVYNIRSKANPDERNVEFDLECDTGVAV